MRTVIAEPNAGCATKQDAVGIWRRPAANIGERCNAPNAPHAVRGAKHCCANGANTSGKGYAL